MWVKICANTNQVDALQAAEAGADAVGFVFAPSQRQVALEAAAEIVDALPESVEKIGVFATDDPFEVEHYVACAGLTAAQLHSAYDADFVSSLSGAFGGELKIMQAVRYDLSAGDRPAAEKRFVEAFAEAAADANLYALLIDSAKDGASGGLGVAFDWVHVAALLNGVRVPGRRVVLAGGLRPGNVAAAIAAFRPWGVDVASGVEESAGKKDSLLVKEFIQAARGASASGESTWSK